VQLTVLGGRGAWPDAGQACSGYLVEHEGFRLLIDPGYAIVPRLLQRIGADQVDAVFVSHGHPDHCADVNPLLRARALTDNPPAPLPMYAPPDALTAVLALDRPGMLDDAFVVHEFTPGSRLTLGPFDAETRLLPHWRPNAGIRLTAGDQVVVYTGDTGPSPELATLAGDADVLLSEASYVDEVPEDSRLYLFSARQAGQLAAEAGVGRLFLTHLFPGTDPTAALAAAGERYSGPIGVATADVSVPIA
jgi:ribonuclease BN (tRNA processing enzyme)